MRPFERDQEGTSEFMSDDFKDILQNADKIAKSYQQEPEKLKYLKEVIMTLFVDFCKLKGNKTYQSSLENLQMILDNFNHDEVIGFFAKNLS